jgi:alcohol dehydrogenase (cytochrome c)
VFTGDTASNLVAVNASTGQPLWHANLGSAVSNGPMTFELDGSQYVVVGAGDSLFAFVMLPK